MKIIREKITNSILNHCELGSGTRFIDTDLLGFQAWVGTKGISFFLRKRSNGKEYSIKIGHYPDMNVAEARLKAIGILSSLAIHGRPDMSSHVVPTVEEALKEHFATFTRKNTINNARSTKYFSSLFDMKITELTEKNVRSVFESIPYKVTANIALTLFKASVRVAIKKYKIEMNDVFCNIKLNETKAREEYIKNEDAPKFFDALKELSENKRYSVECDMLLMMLITGARKSNVMMMKLENVSNGIWTIPKEEFKGKRIHKIPLGSEETGIIEKYRCGRTEGLVFGKHCHSNFKLERAMKIICEKSGIGKFQIRDLRRTIGSWMLSNGVPIAVVSQKLGHASIAITERVYAHVLPEFSVEATESTIRLMRGDNISH